MPAEGVPSIDNGDVFEEHACTDLLVEATPCGRESQTPRGPWPPCCSYESQVWPPASVAQLGAAGKAALVAESCGRADGPTKSSRQWEAGPGPKEDCISALYTALRLHQCQPHSFPGYAGICRQCQGWVCSILFFKK